MNFRLHLILLPFELLGKHLKLLNRKFLPSDLLCKVRAVFSVLHELYFQVFQVIPEFSYFRFCKIILFADFLIQKFSILDFSLQIIKSCLVVSFDSIEIFLVFQFDHFDMICFFLLELIDGFFFVRGLLKQLTLM